MKKLIRKATMTAVAATVLLAISPAHAIFQAGAQAGQTKVTVKDTKDNDFSGLSYGAFARLTFGIPMVLTIGAGPFAQFGTLAYDGDQTGVKDLTMVKAGAEVIGMLDLVPVVTPYAKLGFAYQGYKQDFDYTVGGQTTTYSLAYTGTSTEMTIGAAYKIIPLIYAFGEYSLTTGKIDSEVPDAVKAVFPEKSYDTSGYNVSLGVMLYI